MGWTHFNLAQMAGSSLAHKKEQEERIVALVVGTTLSNRAKPKPQVGSNPNNKIIK